MQPDLDVVAARRRLAIETTGLTIGAAVSGVAAYAYAAIGTRSLGAAGFAPVSVLWTAWAIAGAALAFPIQHWVVRRLRADGGEEGVRRALSLLIAATVVLGAAAAGASWVARASLFRRDDVIFPLLMGLVPPGSAIMGLLRGGLAGRGRFIASGAALAGENLIRVALAAVAAAAGAGPAVFGWILIGGFAVALASPASLRFRRDGTGASGKQLGFLAGIASGSLLAQLVLTGGPVAMAMLDAPAREITAVFAGLALFRAPFLVANGVASRFTHLLTGFVVEGKHARLRAALALTVAGTAVAAIAGALIARTTGPAMLRGLFGQGTDLPASELAIIGAGSGVALGTLAQGLVLISRGHARTLGAAWAISLGSGLAWVAFTGGAPAARVVWAFLVAEGTAFALMLLAEARVLSLPPAPGPEEPPDASEGSVRLSRRTDPGGNDPAHP